MNTSQLVAIARGWEYRYKELGKYLKDNQPPIPPIFNVEKQNREKK